jgi:hypothetical protein
LQDRCFAGFVFSDQASDIRYLEFVRINNGFEFPNMDLLELHSSPQKSLERNARFGSYVVLGHRIVLWSHGEAKQKSLSSGSLRDISLSASMPLPSGTPQGVHGN